MVYSFLTIKENVMINKSAKTYRYNSKLKKGEEIENKEGSLKRYSAITLSSKRDDRLTGGRPGKWLPYLRSSYSQELL